VVEGAAEGRASGVGDEDVDRPDHPLDLGGKRGEALEVGGVGDEGRGRGVDRGGSLLDPLPRAAGDRDAASSAGKGGGDRPAYSTAGAHHQGRASPQP
jgi:hypothetical protein